MTILDQYRAARERHPGMMLLFRIGDFFECFGQDATDLQALCGTMLTGAGDDAKSGFPHHSLEQYLRKLLQAGKRVAICDSVEDEKAAKRPRRLDVPRPERLLF
jgi:DNA mismatch repair protein MutS